MDDTSSESSFSSDSTTPPDHAAAHAVFETAELLENVFLLLPLNRILRMQGVCKHWHRSIQQSPKLQQVLFLRPVGTSYVKWRPQPSSGFHQVGMWKDSKNKTRVFPMVNVLMRRFMLVNFGVFLSIIHLGFVSPTFDRMCKVCIADPDYDMPEEEIHGQGRRSRLELAALHSKGASWRNMLFMQPPCRKMKFRCDTRDEIFQVSNAQGVTVQDVVDTLRSHWQIDPLCMRYGDIDHWDFEGCRTDDIGVLEGDGRKWNGFDVWREMQMLGRKQSSKPWLWTAKQCKRAEVKTRMENRHKRFNT